MPAGLPEVFPVRRGVGLPALDKTRHERARETRRERRTFANAHRAEVQYGRQLRSIAQQVGRLCRFYDPADATTSAWVVGALRRYAAELWPWAMATSKRMLADVMRRDDRAWARLSANMGRALRAEIQGAPTGELMRAMLHEQASLITSLPIDAAHRVHEWTVRGIEEAARPAKIAEEIYRTGEVTKSRAMLIARTEVARTSSKLVEARARHVGSEGYIWRTAGDADVRPGHKRLDGQYFRWDDPPVAGSNGERAHAGQIYNCRCVPEPVVPEEFAA